ncbi:MAG: hypothetical protein ACXVCH_18610 [Bdellovibrionota bacterium]
MIRRVLFPVIAVFLAALALGVLLARLRSSKDPARLESTAQYSPLPATSRPGNPVHRAEVAAANQADNDEGWNRFKERFGKDLRPEFYGGKLVSISGTGTPAGKEFDPTDPQKVIARGREMIEAAKDLLKIDPAFPPGNPRVHGTEASAQVFFEEEFDGIPVEPHGPIKVDLDSDGGLSALYSDYVPNVHITNNKTLVSGEDAKSSAVAAIAMTQFMGGPGPIGGNQVLWVRNGNEGRRAYEYNVQGWQVIVDAGDGSILSKHDKRQR